MSEARKYSCVRVRQKTDSKELLMFSASAIEIASWIGIPQRLSLAGNETAGFQRTVSPAREAALRKFFADNRNVVQNPLLCAIRLAPGVQVTFCPASEGSDVGHVEIVAEDYSRYSMSQLLAAARLYLESRVPSLRGREVSQEILQTLEQRLGHSLSIIEETEDDEISSDESVEEDAADEEPAEDALFDESQISDFWDQLRAREMIAQKLEAAGPLEEILGFSRTMLESYLRPIILVDGQHRLRGAILAASDAADLSVKARDLILEGMSSQEAKQAVMSEVVHALPISLLMDDSPAEHVFQYVVVNQKATPVPKALLGTIISTSLAQGELTTIAERLENAKIPLQGSQIISILSRDFSSPFAGLVAKGLKDEGNGKLQWSVLGSLADMFRYLQGGKLYHDTTSTDHAKIWRTYHLEASPIVGEWQAREYASAYDYWMDVRGPWLKVFMAFWRRTRDILANVQNPGTYNYWGNPRDSNIFNKPSLHILAADFFSYLREQKTKIERAEQIEGLVDDWLEYVSKQYFARDWKLLGVKKDSVGTRRQWSKLWVNHRQTGGNPPPVSDFSKLYKG